MGYVEKKQQKTNTKREHIQRAHDLAHEHISKYCEANIKSKQILGECKIQNEDTADTEHLKIRSERIRRGGLADRNNLISVWYLGLQSMVLYLADRNNLLVTVSAQS